MDRNIFFLRVVSLNYKSLSARRAWIEIYHFMPNIGTLRVALRKESVDRNGDHRDDVPD